MDRREFIKRSMLLTAGTLIGGNLLAKESPLEALADAAKSKKVVGLQLYSLRTAMGKDPAGTLKVVSDMGYGTLETAGYNDGKLYGYSSADFKKMCGDLGMTVTCAHLNQSYTKAREAEVMEWWKKALDSQAEVGCKYVVQPSFRIGNTLDSIKEQCDYFNMVGDLANKRGMKFGFHNHAGEFKKIDDKIIYDYMLENTDPEKVMYELDVYWIQQGGYNPVDYINKYGKRIPLLHIKDECAIGESGKIDFEAIYKAAYKNKMQGYYVEVERYTVGPEEDVKRSFEFLNNAKYVK